MNIKNPIVVAEGLDVILYRTVPDAESALEAVDVKAGIYKAYDAEGRLLNLEVITGKRPVFRGLIKTTGDRIHIYPAEVEPNHKNELRDTLVTYFSKTGTPIEDLTDLSLEQLIQKALKL